jgi:sulfonate transport system ATP-binding protein
MHELLRRLCVRHHPAVLLVTHDVDEAIQLADRVLALDRGRVAADIAVDLPAHAAYASKRFAELRSEFLGLLGVAVPGAAQASPDL